MTKQPQRYNIVRYTLQGAFVAVVSGMGVHAGTWGADHSRRTAQRYAADLRKQDKAHLYKVEAI